MMVMIEFSEFVVTVTELATAFDVALAGRALDATRVSEEV
jgi:hypothetical protein